jgi:hypothetical protein
MPIHVQFRFNKITGQVEQFVVDDQDRTLTEDEHDRIATDVATTVARNPAISELTGPLPATANRTTDREPAVEDQRREDTRTRGST